MERNCTQDGQRKMNNSEASQQTSGTRYKCFKFDLFQPKFSGVKDSVIETHTTKYMSCDQLLCQFIPSFMRIPALSRGPDPNFHVRTMRLSSSSKDFLER